MSRESDKTDFALLLGLRQRLHGSVMRKMKIGIVVVNHFMDLP